jgi:hypothetical protein
MRIKGPTNGAQPPGSVEDTGAVERTDGVEELAPAEAPIVEGTAPAGDAMAEVVGRVAARLRSGELTVEQAVELLIDDAIERQVGRAVESAADLEPQLRDLLRSYASSDPFIAARIRRLTQAK